jgi:hypothetical protein
MSASPELGTDKGKKWAKTASTINIQQPITETPDKQPPYNQQQTTTSDSYNTRLPKPKTDNQELTTDRKTRLEATIPSCFICYKNEAEKDRPTTTDRQRQNDKDRPTTTDWQRLTDNDRPTTTDWQQQTDNDKPTTTDRQRKTNNDRPTTQRQWQADNDRPTTTDRQRQTDNDRPTTTDRQRQTDNDRPTTTDRQRQTDNDRPTTTDRQLQTDNEWSTTTDRQRHYISFINSPTLCSQAWTQQRQPDKTKLIYTDQQPMTENVDWQIPCRISRKVADSARPLSAT